MDYTVNSKVRSAGISEGNRKLLALLHQKTSGPFTIAQASELSESINDELFTGFEAAKVPSSEDSGT